MLRRRMSPLGALLRGAIAGAVATSGQALLARFAPSEPEDAFNPPEQEQKFEEPTETVARRTVEQLAQRGPVADRKKAGKLVAYGFGSSWGALYGAAAGSLRRFNSLPAALGFGALVWEASENVLLPAFRLRGEPKRYPVKVHAFDAASHLAFGAAVYAVFGLLGGRRWLRERTA